MIRPGTTQRRVLIGVASGLVLTAVGAIAVLQSAWFNDYLRSKTVAAVREATGGDVHLQGFKFHWPTLACDLTGLTIRGTEPPQSAPLFSAESVQFRLPFPGLLHGISHLGSVTIRNPRVHVWVRPDGTLNIPRLSHPNPLMAVSIRGVSISGGMISVNGSNIPVKVAASRLSFAVQRASSASPYRIDLNSNELRVERQGSQPFGGSLHANAELDTNRLTIRHFALSSGGLNAAGTGTVTSFANPLVRANMTVQASAEWAREMLPCPGLQAGDIEFSGNVEYRPGNSFDFRGHSELHNAVYSAHQWTSPVFEARADVNAARDLASFRNLHAAFAGGALEGSAEVQNWDRAVFEGRLQGFALRQVRKPLSGSAAGPIQAEFHVSDPIRTLRVHAELAIAPGHGRIPMSGTISADYDAAQRRLSIQNANIKSGETAVQVSGTVGQSLEVHIASSDALQLQNAASLLGTDMVAITGSPARTSPPATSLFQDSGFKFDGEVTGSTPRLKVSGLVSLTKFGFRGAIWSTAQAVFSAGRDQITITTLTLTGTEGSASLAGRLPLHGGSFDVTGSVHASNIAYVLKQMQLTRQLAVSGEADASFKISGTLQHPNGVVALTAKNLDAFGQRAGRISVRAALNGDTVRFTGGRVEASLAVIGFAGVYQRQAGSSWNEGLLDLQVHTAAFPLESIQSVREHAGNLSGRLAGRARLVVDVTPAGTSVKNAEGALSVTGVEWNSFKLGALAATLATDSGAVRAAFDLNGRVGNVHGSAIIDTTAHNPLHATVRGKMNAPVLAQLLDVPIVARPITGEVDGNLIFDSSLSNLHRYRAAIDLRRLNLKTNIAGKGLNVFNTEPVRMDASDGIVTIRSFHVRDSAGPLAISGTGGVSADAPLELKIDGSLDLQAFENVEPTVTSSGKGLLNAHIGGTLRHPKIEGSLKVRDAALSATNFAAAVTNVNGSIRFAGDRAVIDDLAGQSGGGHVQASGSVSLTEAGAVSYNLSAAGNDVRFEPTPGISVTGNASLRMSGTSQNGLLSGAVVIDRIVINPQSDLADFITSGRPPEAAPANPNGVLAGLQIDVRFMNSPSLQINTALSRDIKALIDLRLRGTPERAVLLGSVTAEEGDLRIFGAKYSINRCQITFANTAQIDPILDLDLQTVSRGVTVDITVSGTLNRLNFNYRSDPPLQPKDIVALLTVGQPPPFTPTTPAVQPSATNLRSLQSSATSVLGQAISPGANRLSRLFGVTNIKLDPLVTGVTNTPQSRLTLEQQISTNVTVTYVTNLAQTSEQIFRFEWALNPRYSIVAVRDDNGEFGIDLQYKRRF